MVEDGRAGEQLLEESPALSAGEGPGHEGVLPANLLLVEVEAVRGRTQDGQVEVEEEAQVAIRGLVGPGCEDVARDPLPALGRHSQGLEPPAGELRALFLVRALPGDVDGVVEPEGQFDLRPLGEALPGVEALQAIGDVIERVVVPPAFAVPLEELLPDLATKVLGAGGPKGSLEPLRSAVHPLGLHPFVLPSKAGRSRRRVGSLDSAHSWTPWDAEAEAP